MDMALASRVHSLFSHVVGLVCDLRAHMCYFRRVPTCVGTYVRPCVVPPRDSIAPVVSALPLTQLFLCHVPPMAH